MALVSVIFVDGLEFIKTHETEFCPDKEKLFKPYLNLKQRHFISISIKLRNYVIVLFTIGRYYIENYPTMFQWF